MRIQHIKNGAHLGSVQKIKSKYANAKVHDWMILYDLMILYEWIAYYIDNDKYTKILENPGKSMKSPKKILEKF